MTQHETVQHEAPVVEDVLAALREYVLRHILQNDTNDTDGTGGADGAEDAVEIDGHTPLLEWGILNSLSTAELVGHIRSRFDVLVPPEKVTGANFRNLNAVAALVVELHGTHRARPS
ncbi:Acyl carrier protein [Streptoalloteichus tenebrarius]|uniref:Acyl carrier protein n=1 Tax=Streptoalloteichus tenebrarius (strain ATCC 17920 / DSM 40477 / JCM 4838 / CBS 697.72 / NBRC 16177 / NCIMB 11028 / NRRL B-12390 / A12253. 1 / ISP 5477) TaxID=1933 RepID=A0ABT1HPI4_STRSD|nr:acyl carrier protein [Streptoalloteichus tenebrarius]MCP2257425.1 Acyl carrier protein [Streptoalloteichus tenebrarius]BFE98370.1 hypothetical protein GCM10020241_00460 [Streptoalloteichus tenebrarius]